jgi:hypothetical protein
VIGAVSGRELRKKGSSHGQGTAGSVVSLFRFDHIGRGETMPEGRNRGGGTFMRIANTIFVMLLLTGAASAQGVKLVDPTCEGPFQRYSAASPGMKAFAAGRKLGCGWQRQGPGFTDIQSIRAQAIKQCTANGGDQCRVIAEVR